MNAVIGDLERRAESGDCEAQIAVARSCEAEEKTALARGWYARAAKQGSVAALRSLAINLLTKAPIVERDGVNMIRAAAHRGDAEAACVCGMLAAQDHRLGDRWTVARECLVRAADRGWESAREQLLFLDRIGCGGDMAALARPLPVQAVSQSPRIGAIEGFAAQEICDWLIARARPRMGLALVYDKTLGSGRVESARNNSSVAFDISNSDIVLMLIRARIAATAEIPPEGLEASALLHYAPGQQFEPHFDYLDPSVPGYAADLAAHGQRVATFLLYLNEDYEGGETDFPELGWRYKGRKGDALLFWNVQESGSPDPRMLHAGLPPGTGEKWLLSQWLRQPRGTRG
jgi:prolyl 4-hydroxylase